MIGLPANVDVHLYFLLQADIKEFAFLEIHFNVLKHVFRKTTYECARAGVCACVCL